MKTTSTLGTHRHTVVLALLLVVEALFLAPLAQAADGPARVLCSQRAFPNLPGQNAVTLSRQSNGTYTARYESYGAPKTKKDLTCVFDGNPLIFHCLAPHAVWGIFGSKVDERTIDRDGKASEAHVYSIQAVKAPEGEPHTEQDLRFPLDTCKADK